MNFDFEILSVHCISRLFKISSTCFTDRRSSPWSFGLTLAYLFGGKFLHVDLICRLEILLLQSPRKRKTDKSSDEPRSEVIKLFSCLTQVRMKF